MQKQYIFLMLFLWLSGMMGSQPPAVKFLDSDSPGIVYKKMYNWAVWQPFLLRNTDKESLKTIPATETRIKALLLDMITNFKDVISIKAYSPIEEFGYFKQKYEAMLLERFKELQKDLISNEFEQKNIINVFKKIEKSILQYYSNLPIDNLMEDTLKDYYYALFYWANDQKEIINFKMANDSINFKDSVDKKWPALIVLIKKNLDFMFKEKLFLTSDLETEKQIKVIKHDIENIKPNDENYKIIFNSIKNNYEQYEKFIESHKQKFENLAEFYKAIITWEAKQELNTVERTKDIIPTLDELSNLIYYIWNKIRQAYAQIKDEDKLLVAWNKFPTYEHLLDTLKNLEPQNERQFEDAFHFLQNAYDMYKKIMQNVIEQYINWAVENGLCSKKELAGKDLQAIIELIQTSLIHSIDVLLTKYVSSIPVNTPLLSLKSSIEKQTSLLRLNDTYIKFLHEKGVFKNKIKAIYVNWAVGNGLITENEVVDKALEAVIDLIKQELLKRVEPLAEMDQKTTDDFKKNVQNSISLSDLSKRYVEYLNIERMPKRNFNSSEIIEPSRDMQSANTAPEPTKSWWQRWPSWLKWPFRK